MHSRHLLEATEAQSDLGKTTVLVEARVGHEGVAANNTRSPSLVMAAKGPAQAMTREAGNLTGAAAWQALGKGYGPAIAVRAQNTMQSLHTVTVSLNSRTEFEKKHGE